MMAENTKSVVGRMNLDASETEKAGGSQKVKITQEDVRGHDGTLSSAATMWMCRNGPIVYNKFQSLYYGLLRMGFEDQDKVLGETTKEAQSRLKMMWDELSTEVHGSDYLAEAMQLVAKEKEESKKRRLEPSVQAAQGPPERRSRGMRQRHLRERGDGNNVAEGILHVAASKVDRHAL